MLDAVIGHHNVKKSLRDLKDKVPRVLIFAGPRGVGKRFTAESYIQEFFGRKLEGHPDVVFFEPEKKIFTLEIVHKVQEQVYVSPMELSRKFIVLRHADRMNKEASHTCLKMFEECPPNVTFILLVENIEAVLQTILSRAVILNFFPVMEVREHFPELSETQIKLMGGCLGLQPLVTSEDTEVLYSQTKHFVQSFGELSYAEILEWAQSQKDADYDFLCNVLNVAAAESQRDETSIALMEGVNTLKETLYLSVNHGNHFRNMLVQVKSSLLKEEHVSK